MTATNLPCNAQTASEGARCVPHFLRSSSGRFAPPRAPWAKPAGAPSATSGSVGRRLDLDSAVIAQDVRGNTGRLPVRGPWLRLEKQEPAWPERRVDTAKEAKKTRISKVEMNPLRCGKA
eukprot:scaffold58999_cov30-Tisochrysis_lutea.AAC.2